ncbi:GNAT family N-acetyltransferase [Candidatus Micrarchaeota archaeon]|nr:GNAT family N-acetyltransferase [Candidatus Micrarchaeota archaeon]
MVSFQFATLDDFDFVWSGRQEIADIEKFVIPDPPAEKERAKKAIKDNRIYLAVENSKPIGFIWFIVSTATPFGVDYGLFDVKYAYIDYVYVEQNSRNKGIGKLLYAKLDEYCKENNIEQILCDIYKINEKSILFHEKMGFSPFVSVYSKKIQ